MSDLHAELRRHYVAAGLHDGERATVAADSCLCAAECWASEPESRRPEPKNAGAYRPWVGHKYETTRMVVVGVNLYDHGGWDGVNDLINLAVPLLRERGPCLMTFNHPGYKGTLFYSRAAQYAELWLAATGMSVPLGDVYDHVAFTNHVKCSPKSDQVLGRSPPNAVMWSKCGGHVLAGELRVLGARRVLVVGVENARSLRSHVWSGLESVKRSGRAELLRDADGREILVVPHPASGRGGAARSILGDVSAAVRA